MPTTSLPERALRLARVDWSPSHRQPSLAALLVASVLSVAASLAADRLLVFAGTRMFPSTKGYVHFRFSDYATLTTIGVLVACAGWPVVTRITSAPRWLFFRLAIVATILLWVPDLWLIVRGEPRRAVAVLMVMHLAVAVVTYNLLVRVAPVREAAAPPSSRPGAPDLDGHSRPGSWLPASASHTARETSVRRLSFGLAVLATIEFVLGLVALVLVPLSRSSGWLPAQGDSVYLAHAILGLPLLLGAVALVLRARGSQRTLRAVAWIGLVGVAMAGVGGLLTVQHPLRLLGMALMFVGPMVAGFAYLIPALDRSPVEAAS